MVALKNHMHHYQNAHFCNILQESKCLSQDKVAHNIMSDRLFAILQSTYS